MSAPSPAGAVLLVIDLQKAIDHPSWGVRNNAAAERNVARLLAHWRARAWPVWHVRHDSTEPHSQYRPGQQGHDFKPETAPLAGEPVIAKRVHSAFIGTDLDTGLRTLGHATLVVVGVITNNSVETTVRHAANLGYAVFLPEDACFTFGRNDWHGAWRSAAEVHAMSLANLHGEYCTVTSVAEILSGCG